MKQKKVWPWVLILSVISLTIFHILPTLCYYLQPLKSPLSESQGMRTAESIAKRLNAMEDEAIDWLRAYCDLLGIAPASIAAEETNPQIIRILLTKGEDAARLRTWLPRAGALIAEPSAQLTPLPDVQEKKTVYVLREIPGQIDVSRLEDSFTYVHKTSPEYLEWIVDRAAVIAASAGGPSVEAMLLGDSNLAAFSSQVQEMGPLLKESPLLSTYCSKLSHGFARLSLDELLSSCVAQRDELKKKNETSSEISTSLLLTESFLKKHRTLLSKSSKPLTYDLAKAKLMAQERPTVLPLDSIFFSSLVIDWNKETYSLPYRPEYLELKERLSTEDLECLEQQAINEIARIARTSGETFQTNPTALSLSFHQLPETTGLLLVRADLLLAKEVDRLAALLQTHFRPKHPDLLQENFPIVRESDYQALSELQQKLCLRLLSPLSDKPKDKDSYRHGSLYVIANGLGRMLEHARKSPNSEGSQQLLKEFNTLAELMHRCKFFGSMDEKGNYVFEKPDAAASILAATREDFILKGSKQWAAIECSNLEQRILADNRIETKIHEDLLKWQDDYNSAQISFDGRNRFDVPKPTKSVFWNNLLLTFKKIVRGDERKVIRWGLDLSGGKTVQIELRDANHKPVTSEIDVKQGINELYARVNKMGVSEVAIRQAGHHIVLDFPGSQSLSAKELVKASSMVFHIVNETFSSSNPQLGPSVQQFLQEVWNEATVHNQTDVDSINRIAYEHLQKGTIAAKTLSEQGLRLEPPELRERSSDVDETYSKIALFRGEDFKDWYGETHPLLIVFSNYALEGSNLTRIQSSYDPSKGNYLSFEVKNSSQSGGNPQQELHGWTSRFSQDGIVGTHYEEPTRGHGWRMAVLLNDSVISAPALHSALKDSAMISGNFSQREVAQLVSDLKAGSLTYTPHILSEKNVSPELGKSERTKGILATVAALLLVILSMLAYYRFAGLVASVAVLFNLLIMWAVLQNIQATLTLAGIAGIILTVGMAVDANVLVFERIKEEFQITKRIASAIEAGYQKAFSAILDSNVTTIIAALILLNFDSGPIKGFAVTLIIGIASSMFTALFMTRTYFASWVKNPKHQSLKMSNWISNTNFDFLKRAKFAFVLSGAIAVIGIALLINHRQTILGMDFTGGYSVELEVKSSSVSTTAAEDTLAALLKQGLSSTDVQVRELNPSNHLRLLFSTSMDLPEKPFHQMTYDQQTTQNPRIEWVKQALQESGLALNNNPETSWTALSGQMSDAMRNNALIGLLIALAFIFAYLMIRFEASFAASALLCLMHDVLITLGAMGILYACNIKVQIDLNTIAALMTIIGYSLNDTIIIFDRIREERLHGSHLPTVINRAINTTLSRTSITSGTTLLVLVALVLLGGSSIFSFALVMTIGVFFGTLSSWFIAAPLLLSLLKRKKEQDLSVELDP